MKRMYIGAGPGMSILARNGAFGITFEGRERMNRDQKVGFLVGMAACGPKYVNMMHALAEEWEIDLEAEVNPPAVGMMHKLAGMALRELKVGH